MRNLASRLQLQTPRPSSFSVPSPLSSSSSLLLRLKGEFQCNGECSKVRAREDDNIAMVSAWRKSFLVGQVLYQNMLKRVVRMHQEGQRYHLLSSWLINQIVAFLLTLCRGGRTSFTEYSVFQHFRFT